MLLFLSAFRTEPYKVVPSSEAKIHNMRISTHARMLGRDKGRQAEKQRTLVEHRLQMAQYVM
jgi:hypothetical protein